MKVEDLPGLATPWPHRTRFANTRRLLAAWRWQWERGEDSEAAKNAFNSIREHTATLGVEVIEDA